MADNTLVSKDSSNNITLDGNITLGSTDAYIELEPANDYVNAYTGGQRYIFTNQRFTVPSTDTGTIDLGNSSARWDKIYGRSLNIEGGNEAALKVNGIFVNHSTNGSLASAWLHNWKSEYPSSNSNACVIRCDGDLINQDGMYGQISDEKYKENIIDCNSQWEDIKCLKFKNFYLKNNPDKKLLGLVAQEVEKHCPYLVNDEYDKEKEEYFKSLKQSILYMKGMKALQEAIERIETLEEQSERTK